MTENVLFKDYNYLFGLSLNFESNEINYLKSNFCGKVVNSLDECTNKSLLYLYGNIAEIKSIYSNKLDNFAKINVIKELSINYDEFNIISIGNVPLNIYNVGIYFREFFDNDKDYFKSIINEHEFQSLTESNKPNNALRKGIYITNVEKLEDDAIKFNLLRCSSNLGGASDNFRTTDKEIINKVNDIAQYFFEQKVELNHVLAQVYNNNKDTHRKAKIKDHSDKTKDMPINALMAFCTFYNRDELGNAKKSLIDDYDYVYNNTSVLTCLRFRLKECVELELEKEFNVLLYPNSVFLMSLNTNRLYTHEICPSVLNVEHIPTRMGYVIRCSKTNAIYKNNKTYIINDGIETEMVSPDEDGINRLKKLYYIENMTSDMIKYEGFNFSLNNGDYVKPYL